MPPYFLDGPALAGFSCPHLRWTDRCGTASQFPRGCLGSPRLCPAHRGPVSVSFPGYTDDPDAHDRPAFGPDGLVYDAPVRAGGLP